MTVRDEQRMRKGRKIGRRGREGKTSRNEGIDFYISLLCLHKLTT